MTLLSIFNSTLKTVNSISKDLESKITIYSSIKNWPEQKKHHALAIVRQLNDDNLLVCGKCLGHEFVDFRSLKLTLTAKEWIGRENVIFKLCPEYVSSADNYVKELLNDINELSPTIKFSFAGHEPKIDKIIINIAWEF